MILFTYTYFKTCVTLWRTLLALIRDEISRYWTGTARWSNIFKTASEHKVLNYKILLIALGSS